MKNPVSHNRSKHIDIKYRFIRKKYSKGLIELVYVPSGNNIADIMTKRASKVKLNLFRHYCLDVVPVIHSSCSQCLLDYSYDKFTECFRLYYGSKFIWNFITVWYMNSGGVLE